MTPTNESPSSPRLIYAASESCADMLYATGFHAPDPFLWFDCEGRSCMIVSSLEFGRARKTAKAGIEVYTLNDAFERFDLVSDQRSTVEFIRLLSRKKNVATWLVPSSFPLGLAEKLAAAEVKVKSSTPLFPQRICKTEREIELIGEGVALAEKGMMTAIRIIDESVVDADGGALVWNGRALTSEILRSEIDVCIMRGGGIPLNTIVAGGRQSADPHEMGSGVLRESEPVVIDIFPRVAASGFFGDLTRTLVKGVVPTVVGKAHKAVAAAQKAATEMVAPGVACRDLHEKAVKVLAEHGFATGSDHDGHYGFIHGLGHGLGLEIHEAPRVSAKSESILKPGMVITVEPGLYYPDWGGVRLENVVAVTAAGHRVLTRIP